MSVITDMLLLTSEELNSAPIKALNKWCDLHGDGQTFRPIDVKEEAGGRKVFCTRVYACAGNFFPWQELLAALPSFGWNSYAAETTVLILQHEDHESWVAVHADGRPVPSTEAGILKSYSRGEDKRAGYVIRCGEGYNAGFWSAPHARWVHDAEKATVYYGHAGELAIKPLVPQDASVRLVHYPEEA